MYSLNCDYYQKEFNYLHELIDDVLMSGMDPNYEITKNGVGIKEMLNEIIGFWYMVVFLLLVFWVLLVVDERESTTEINNEPRQRNED